MADNGNEGGLRRKLDRFWATLFLTPEGRPKSARLLYSFCLCILFAIVCGIAYFFLIDVIEAAFSGAPVVVRNILESLIPGVLASAACCSLFFLFKDRQLVPLAYLWMWVFDVAILVTMAFLCTPGEYGMFLHFFASLALVPLLAGTAVAFCLYRRSRQRTAA